VQRNKKHEQEKKKLKEGKNTLNWKYNPWTRECAFFMMNHSTFCYYSVCLKSLWLSLLVVTFNDRFEFSSLVALMCFDVLQWNSIYSVERWMLSGIPEMFTFEYSCYFRSWQSGVGKSEMVNSWTRASWIVSHFLDSWSFKGVCNCMCDKKERGLKL
jgi:hypothetical protein